MEHIMARHFVILVSLFALGGCSLVALPLRVTADVARVVPVVGDVVAAPVDAAADIID